MAGVKTGISGQINNNIVTDGLVFYMDPAYKKSYPRTGATVTDIIGNTTGTLSGAGGDNNTPQWENIKGGIFDFDGTDDYIDCADTTYLNGVSQMSLSIWFNLNTAEQNKGLISDRQSAGADGHFTILTKSISGNGYSFRLGLSRSDAVEASIQISNQPFTAGQWHNMIMTYNAGTVKFYADGIFVSSAIYRANNGIPTTLGSTAEALDIGRYSTLEWDGKISSTFIYTKEISASEVTQNYQAQKERFGF